MIEVQSDCIDNSANQCAAQTPAIPMDLTSSEKTRFATEVIAGNKLVRMAAGLYFRGTTNNVGGFDQNIIERWAGQKTDLAAMFASAGAGTKAYYNYFSVAPYWKTIGTSPCVGVPCLDNGTLWAGGANARTVTLDSIRGSDPTGYANQIDALTTAMVVDVEYFHANIACVGMFGLQNEPDRNSNFGNVSYPNDGILYHDVYASVMPKLQASVPLQTCSGNAQTIVFSADSWRAPTDGTYLYPNVITADATTLAALSGGAWFRHDIVTIGTDANVINTNAATWNTARRGIPLGSDERWNVEECVGTPNTTTGQCSTSGDTEDFRWSNEVLVALNFIGLTGATIHNPLIHASKPTTSAGVFPIDGYGWTAWRPPGSATPAAPWNTLADGEFSNAGNFFWSSNILQRDYIPQGAQIYKMLEPATSNQRAVGWTLSAKTGVAMVNRSSTAYTFRINVQADGIFLNCSSFNSTSRTPIAMGSYKTVGETLTVVAPIWSGVVCQQP